MIETNRFSQVVDAFYKQLLEIQAEITNINLAEDKWSLKEIIGHLIDSASNNHQRFVRLQFDNLLDFPVYIAEEWIKVQKYNKMNWNILIELWYNYNRLLVNIIESIDETKYENVWIKNEDAISLDQLILDYYKHFELHMEHLTSRQKELLAFLNAK